MSMPALELRGVTRRLPGPVPVTLVSDINLSVAPGEFIAITGPSGSGKSSLLYLLGLMDRPTEGQVLLEGQETQVLSETRRAELRLAKLGFVFQFHFLLPEFSVLDNVLLPLRKAGKLSAAAMQARVEALLANLDLSDSLHKLPSQLSGGQRQRAAIARALANEPRAILADEPTGNLDTKNAERVFDTFEKLAQSLGCAIVTVTHDPALAARAHRRVQVVDGRLVP